VCVVGMPSGSGAQAQCFMQQARAELGETAGQEAPTLPTCPADDSCSAHPSRVIARKLLVRSGITSLSGCAHHCGCTHLIMVRLATGQLRSLYSFRGCIPRRGRCSHCARWREPRDSETATPLPACEPETPEKPVSPSGWSHIKDILCPFHDASANARFLALALGGMLCSIATLIHDSYLPIFMRDELGMSNSVRSHSMLVPSM
jgi:hypothetical protein